MCNAWWSLPAIGFFMSAPCAVPVMVEVLQSTTTLAEPTDMPMPLVTDSALPSTNSASESTFGGVPSVITMASGCLAPLVDPLPISILPPVLTQVTEPGFTPGRSAPPTLNWSPLPLATLGAELDAGLDAGLAGWPPLEQATRADAQPRVPIAPTRRRFTAFPSFMRRPVGVVMGASTDRPRCYRSQFRPRLAKTR